MLPILHLNGYKIANPTVLGRLGEEQLNQLFTSYGCQTMAATLDTAIKEIRAIQDQAGSKKSTGLPVWPMIVVRTPKGWTGPKFVDGKPVEGTWRAHQVSMADMQKAEHLKILEEWMRSYRPEQLFDHDHRRLHRAVLQSAALHAAWKLHPEAYLDAFVPGLYDTSSKIAREALLALSKKPNLVGGQH